MGYFKGGRFHLTVSLRYQPARNERRFIGELFNKASRILSDATYGAHSIGTVMYSTDSTGGADADVWIHPGHSVWPDASGARLWFPTESLDISQDFLMWPTILAHELSHYVYDVLDEYNNRSICQGDIATHASLMEKYPWTGYTRWTSLDGTDFREFAAFLTAYAHRQTRFHRGQPAEFCHAGNHNTRAHNNQNRYRNQQSCWTYMANDANHNDIRYGLVAPVPGGPKPAPPPAPPKVKSTRLIPMQRFMLVVDHAAGITDVEVEQLKIGANFFIDYVNPPEEIGVVTHPAADVQAITRSEVPPSDAEQAWRDDRHRAIDDFTPDGAPAIGAALRRGLDAVLAGGRASSQVIVLFSNGLQDAGDEPVAQVLADLRASGVRVYTVGLGSDQDAALLESVATTTAASYFPIPGDLSPEQAAAAITHALVQIAGQGRENGGVLAFEDIDDTGAPLDERTPFFGSVERQGNTGAQSLRFPVTISTSSTHATLGVIWRERRTQARVRIYDPSGAVVAVGPDVRAVGGPYPYAFYEVDQPLPGTWVVEVSGSQLGSAGLRSIGFEVNSRVRLEMTATPHHATLTEEIHLRARLLSPHPVRGARMIAHVYSPAGSWMTVTLDEASEGSAEEGLYIATVPTDRDRPGPYLVVLDAFTDARQFTIGLDELYTSSRADFEPGQETQTVSTPEVHRRAVLSVVTSQRVPTKGPITGANDVDPILPEDHDERLASWLRKHPRKRRSMPTPS